MGAEQAFALSALLAAAERLGLVTWEMTWDEVEAVLDATDSSGAGPREE